MNKRHLIVAGVIAASSTAIGFGTVALASADSTGTKTSTHQRIRWDARLNQAERDGTITAAQKAAFKTELKTLRAEHKSAISKSSTKAERQAERTKLKIELQAWAKANNFPLSKLAPKLAG